MSTAQLIVRRRIGDIETPVAAMLKLGAETPGSFLFESIAGGERLGRYSFIGLEPDRWFRILDGKAQIASDAEFSDARTLEAGPVEALKAFARDARAEADEALPPMASGAFGYVGYDMIQYVEPVEITKPGMLNVPEALLVIPRVVIVFDHIYQEILLIGRVEGGDEAEINALLDDVETRLERLPQMPPKDQEPAPVDLQSNTSKERYFEIVDRCKEYIRAGDIFQVVPSQRFSAPFPRQSISYYRALRRLNPSAFMFHMNLGTVSLVGSSPEILVRVRDGRVAIRPIAGTRPRSGNDEEDARRAASLLADPKEIAEHLMLLDLGRNDVGRVAAYGSVTVTEQFIVERYSHVMHIVSNVTGRLKDNTSCLDVLRATLPAGTLSGAPKIRAMEIIDELEPVKRGVYGGAVGYLSFNGNMDTAIAIRTAVIKDNTLHIQAGAGVVADSVPRLEWKETMNKGRAIFRAVAMTYNDFDH